MARTLLVLGKPSTGKSTSLRTLDPKTTFIITPNVKELPFPGFDTNYTRMHKVDNPKGNVGVVTSLTSIKPLILHINETRPEIKTIVLEDFSHFLTHKVMGATFANDSGYGKWNKLGSEVYEALFANLDALRSDLILVVIHHTEIKDDGMVQEKSAGKLMDNTIEVNSWYTTILHSQKIDDPDVGLRYVMQTNESGVKLAKSPCGMFKETFVGNNMKNILDDMRAYYGGKPKYPVTFID